MRTKKITLFYKISDSETFPPDPQALRRKDMWIEEIRKTISKAGELRIVRVTYELFNPEVENQRKFFNGPIIDYYAIQAGDILSGGVTRDIHDRYRETILSELLGYEIQLIDRKEKRRKSTSDFTSTQQWHDFFERLRETIFEPEGYEMPESEMFWQLSEQYGYEQAKKISIEQLQKRIIAKMKSA